VPETRVPQSGDIWLVDFSPQIGHEQAGVRPGLVISHDRFNQVPNGLHIVVPITSTDRGLAYHLRIAPPEGNLTRPSVIMCDQEKSQSVRRFERYIGSVTSETLVGVQTMVAALVER
jgi:mRNA interferase MazF